MTLLSPQKAALAFMTAGAHMGMYFLCSLQQSAVMATASVNPDPEKDEVALANLEKSMDHHISETRKAFGLRPQS